VLNAITLPTALTPLSVLLDDVSFFHSFYDLTFNGLQFWLPLITKELQTIISEFNRIPHQITYPAAIYRNESQKSSTS
jgi:hypothetical protein